MGVISYLSSNLSSSDEPIYLYTRATNIFQQNDYVKLLFHSCKIFLVFAHRQTFLSISSQIDEKHMAESCRQKYVEKWNVRSENQMWNKELGVWNSWLPFVLWFGTDGCDVGQTVL